MTTIGAHTALAVNAQEEAAPPHAWRPFPREVSDLLCIEESGADVAPRMHSRSAITVIRSAAVVRCESSRSLVAARNSVLLVPALQLASLRGQGQPTGRTITMLVGESPLHGFEAANRASLVTDADLVEEVEALLARLSSPVPPVDCADALLTLPGRLAESATPVGSMLPRFGTPLVAARDYLRANATAPVTIAELSRVMGLAESHLIRAFHREFGLPPHAYQMRLRLAAACELLEKGLSVSTVAFECGFADQSHLSRNFKAVYGLTPAAWMTAVAGGRPRNPRMAPMPFIARAPRRGLRGQRTRGALQPAMWSRP